MKLKYELVKAEKANYPVTMMTRLLGIHPSGFYKWLKNNSTLGVRAARRQMLAPLIKNHWETSGHAHGARRIQQDLLHTAVLWYRLR